jgi:hypothetical protein
VLDALVLVIGERRVALLRAFDEGVATPREQAHLVATHAVARADRTIRAVDEPDTRLELVRQQATAVNAITESIRGADRAVVAYDRRRLRTTNTNDDG